jgi:FlaA1/EpsC-like NDP-sugar epimerase
MNIKRIFTHGPLYIIWFLLINSFIFSLFEEKLLIAFMAVLTFFLTLLPFLFKKKYNVYISNFFSSFLAFFIYGSIFLGETSAFYTKFAWWDSLLHLFSAVGFGLIITVILLLIFGKKTNQSNPIMFPLFAFCFTVTLGLFWEFFEFFADRSFGFQMQGSNADTMKDLILDCIGASTASIAGYLYLKDSRFNPFGEIIERNYIANKALAKREADQNQNK